MIDKIIKKICKHIEIYFHVISEKNIFYYLQILRHCTHVCMYVCQQTSSLAKAV